MQQQHSEDLEPGAEIPAVAVQAGHQEEILTPSTDLACSPPEAATIESLSTDMKRAERQRMRRFAWLMAFWLSLLWLMGLAKLWLDMDLETLLYTHPLLLLPAFLFGPI